MDKQQLKQLLALLNEQNVSTIEFGKDVLNEKHGNIPLPTKISFKEKIVTEAASEIKVTHYNLFNEELNSLPDDIREIVIENLEEKADDLISKELSNLRYHSS